MIKLTIPGQLPGLNEYIEANRKNRYEGAKFKQDTENLIKWLIAQQLKKGQFTRVSIAFNWYEPNKKRDKDNICFAKKFILDSLQSMRTIPGDGWKNTAGFSDDFYVDKTNPRVEVIISEVGIL